MTSQTELLKIKKNFFLIFKFVTRYESNFNIVLELATRDF